MCSIGSIGIRPGTQVSGECTEGPEISQLIFQHFSPIQTAELPWQFNEEKTIFLKNSSRITGTCRENHKS